MWLASWDDHYALGSPKRQIAEPAAAQDDGNSVLAGLRRSAYRNEAVVAANNLEGTNQEDSQELVAASYCQLLVGKTVAFAAVPLQLHVAPTLEKGILAPDFQEKQKGLPF